MLSHAAPAVGPELGPALLDEAARRLLAVMDSAQQDRADGLLWHGFDAASGAHSCCKWGDGNGWYFMAAADALQGPSTYPWPYNEADVAQVPVVENTTGTPCC